MGAQWLSGRVLDSRLRGHGFEPHRRLCVVSFSKNINPSLVLVQPRKTRPFITERLLMGCKESNQTNKAMALIKIICAYALSTKILYAGPNSYTPCKLCLRRVSCFHVCVCLNASIRHVLFP